MNQSMAKLYSQDGTGRDSYIFCDNGGFYPGNFKLQKRHNIKAVIIILKFSGAYGTHSPQKLISNLKNDNFIQVMALEEIHMLLEMYKIKHFSPDFSFQLRKYDSQIMNPQYPYKLPPLKQAQQSIKSDKQKSLIQRLAKPKLRTQSD